MASKNGIADVHDRKVGVTSSEFSQRFSSKQECFRFLATEVGAYLDAYNTMSIFHLRDIISGNRVLIKSKDIKHIHVPQFPGMSVEKMLEWAKRHPEVYAALPSE